MNVLVTGAAGFIGYHLCQALCQRGDTVIGIDNLNAYYDPSLKNARLTQLLELDHFHFELLDIADNRALRDVFQQHSIDRVVHLAAQAGVRYSIDHPDTYISSNLVGFANLLEAGRHHTIEHLVYASSSSVYGANTTYPYTETDTVDHPVSLYAATKKANETLAHSYAHLYGLPCTGLRFFTVYGPWGRPDMAYFKFVRQILNNESIEMYNNGDMYRDFTYIDDIIQGIVHALDQPAKPDPTWSGNAPNPATSYAPWRIYNIGNNQPIKLTTFIETIETLLGRKADVNRLPLQPGDVIKTAADITRLQTDFNYQPHTPIRQGLAAFIQWYLDYTEKHGPIRA